MSTEFQEVLAKAASANMFQGLSQVAEITLKRKKDEAVNRVVQEAKLGLSQFQNGFDQAEVLRGEEDPELTSDTFGNLSNSLTKVTAEYADAIQTASAKKAAHDKIYQDAMLSLAQIGTDEAKMAMSALNAERELSDAQIERALKTYEVNVNLAKGAIDAFNGRLAVNENLFSVEDKKLSLVSNYQAIKYTNKLRSFLTHKTFQANGTTKKWIEGTGNEKEAGEDVNLLGLTKDKDITMPELMKYLETDILAESPDKVVEINGQVVDLSKNWDRYLQNIAAMVFKQIVDEGTVITYQAPQGGGPSRQTIDSEAQVVYNNLGSVLSVPNTYSWLKYSNSPTAKFYRAIGLGEGGLFTSMESQGVLGSSVRFNPGSYAKTVNAMNILTDKEMKSKPKDSGDKEVDALVQKAIASAGGNVTLAREYSALWLQESKNPNSPFAKMNALGSGSTEAYNYGVDLNLFAGHAGKQVLLGNNVTGLDLMAPSKGPSGEQWLYFGNASTWGAYHKQKNYDVNGFLQNNYGDVYVVPALKFNPEGGK